MFWQAGFLVRSCGDRAAVLIQLKRVVDFRSCGGREKRVGRWDFPDLSLFG